MVLSLDYPKYDFCLKYNFFYSICMYGVHCTRLAGWTKGNFLSKKKISILFYIATILMHILSLAVACMWDLSYTSLILNCRVFIHETIVYCGPSMVSCPLLQAVPRPFSAAGEPVSLAPTRLTQTTTLQLLENSCSVANSPKKRVLAFQANLKDNPQMKLGWG